MELAIKSMITNLTTKSALKKASIMKSQSFHLILQLVLLFLVPLMLLTFRMCHEFGVFEVKFKINLFICLHII